MKFQGFFHQLCMHYINHGTLTYANCQFLNQFVGENRELPTASFQTQIPPHGDRLEVNAQKTKSLIVTYSETFKISYFDSVTHIWLNNAKSINYRAINAYYELIKKYLYSRGKNEFYDFHNKHDWFRVLYVLRQITSHGDNIFSNGVEFPDKGKTLKNHIKPYPDTIKWQNISIVRGQKSEPRINEVQISNLLSFIMIFFTANPDFNAGISDNKTP